MNKVNYKQFNITKDERRQEQKDVIELRRYILSLKERDLNGLRCEGCGATDKP